MRKIIIIAVISLLGIAGHAQSVYFPSQEGMTLEYVNKNPKEKVTGYTAYHFRKIDRKDDNNFSVTCFISTFDDKHKEVDQGMEVTVRVVDGSVYFDGSSMLATLSQDIKIEGNGLIIPSNIGAGQKLEDFTLTIASLGTTTTCSEITVAEQETIVTEAGSFDTYRIDMKLSAKVVFITINGSVSQWYAKEIGDVKTINYDKKGNVSSIRELIKITK